MKPNFHYFKSRRVLRRCRFASDPSPGRSQGTLNIWSNLCTSRSVHQFRVLLIIYVDKTQIQDWYADQNISDSHRIYPTESRIDLTGLDLEIPSYRDVSRRNPLESESCWFRAPMHRSARRATVEHNQHESSRKQSYQVVQLAFFSVVPDEKIEIRNPECVWKT